MTTPPSFSSCSGSGAPLKKILVKPLLTLTMAPANHFSSPTLFDRPRNGANLVREKQSKFGGRENTDKFGGCEKYG